jgi:hypothetical protein
MLRRTIARVGVGAALVLLTSCALIRETVRSGGEQRLAATAPPPRKIGPRVLVFAMDGACPAQFYEAIGSGHAPHLAMLLGKNHGQGVFDHAYAAPNALSVLPSSTIADWTSIFTGARPAYDGVPGDEWFERERMKFYAPVPISVHDLADNAKVVTNDLVGQHLTVPTLFERLHDRAYVSLLSVHRGATFYTTVNPSSLTKMAGNLVAGVIEGSDPEKSLSASIDRESAAKVVRTIEEHGIPDLQVVYFPGIDIFTHASRNPLAAQVQYLENVIDPAEGQVVDEYVKKGELDETYIIFISDHAQIPTLSDKSHQLGTGDGSPFEAVRKAGFRVRQPSLKESEHDYQAVLGYQGFMAYIYLADRSSCRHKHAQCDWKKPPRFEEDVIPVLKTIYRSNKYGSPIPQLRGTLDLIFSRIPSGPGENALPYMVFDGDGLMPISEYLEDHPRPDLARLAQRMNWLSFGPYGNRAGDILLLAKACQDLPIQQRYYFAGITHYTWHGSACEEDGHIPFILAKRSASGVELRDIMDDFGGDSPSQRELTPLIESLLIR